MSLIRTFHVVSLNFFARTESQFNEKNSIFKRQGLFSASAHLLRRKGEQNNLSFGTVHSIVCNFIIFFCLGSPMCIPFQQVARTQTRENLYFHFLSYVCRYGNECWGVGGWKIKSLYENKNKSEVRTVIARKTLLPRNLI